MTGRFRRQDRAPGQAVEALNICNSESFCGWSCVDPLIIIIIHQQQRVSGGDGGGDGGDLVERALLADMHVDDGLREGLEVGGELAEGAAGAVDDVQQEASGEKRVAPRW